MRIVLSLLVILCLSQVALAQDKLHSNSKKAIDLYKQAYELDSVGNIFQSLQLVQDALQKDDSFDEAHLLLFITYMKRNDLNSAVQTLEGARSKVEPSFINRMTLELATFHWSNGRYDEAQKLKENLGKEVRGVNEATLSLVLQSIDMSVEGRKSPLKVDFQELKSPINHFEAQYFPSLTADGTLVFTGRTKGRNGTGENLYLSKFSGGKWKDPESLSENINTERYNEGTASIAADGLSIVFTGCNRPKGIGSCDLYISYFTNEKWSQPENLGNKINTAHWESQPSLSQDGRQLYFVSMRPGGFGGQDLWVSHKINGQWIEPVNLGPTINTNLDDCSPFIYPDGKTLFYASRGKPGFGGYDLFKTQITENGWDVPLNLGFPINTFENQVGYTLGIDGWAYYSDNNMLQQTKLYRFKMPESLLPKIKLNLFTGIIQDAKTKESLSAEIILTDLKKDSTIVSTNSKRNGIFNFVPPDKSKDYMVYANKKGYNLFKERLNNLRKTEGKYLIELKPMAVGDKVILNNILFEFNSSTLNLKAKKELQIALKFLKDNIDIKVEIGGHTDASGETVYNLTLSKERAKTVLDFFVSYGISASRLTYVGYGESSPISIEEGVKSDTNNRRIELVITGI